MNILLVEDEELNRFLMYELLTDMGHTVTMAVDGWEAIKILEVRHNVFGLIFMDIHMPVMDGITSTKQIRKLPTLMDMPIIVLTSDVMNIVGNDELEKLFDGYILKPIDKNKLVEVISNF